LEVRHVPERHSHTEQIVQADNLQKAARRH
jgi:hypothetical protein